MVRCRVQDAADALGLSPARQAVLSAALQLLCGWSRVTDDQVRLGQLVQLCREHGRVVDPKTVARALAEFTRAEIFSYTPARGRGAYATLAVHTRMLEGVQELARDAAGRVVVPFSAASPYSSQTQNPPTPRSAPQPGQDSHDGGRRPTSPELDTTPQGARPGCVEAGARDVEAVMGAIPAVFQQLPRQVLWALRAEIRRQLARGWTPAVLVETLSAPLPPEVRRPLLLARWRLAINLRSVGPRLEPLQRDWYHAERAAANELAAAHRREQQQRDAMISEEIGASLQQKLRAKLGAPYLPEGPALRVAMSEASRAYPSLSLVTAAQRWVAS